MVADIEEVEKVDGVGNPRSETQCKRGVKATNERTFLPVAERKSKNVWMRSRKESENPLQGGNNL